MLAVVWGFFSSYFLGSKRRKNKRMKCSVDQFKNYCFVLCLDFFVAFAVACRHFKLCLLIFFFGWLLLARFVVILLFFAVVVKIVVAIASVFVCCDCWLAAAVGDDYDDDSYGFCHHEMKRCSSVFCCFLLCVSNVLSRRWCQCSSCSFISFYVGCCCSFPFLLSCSFFRTANFILA